MTNQETTSQRRNATIDRACDPRTAGGLERCGGAGQRAHPTSLLLARPPLALPRAAGAGDDALVRRNRCFCFGVRGARGRRASPLWRGPRADARAAPRRLASSRCMRMSPMARNRTHGGGPASSDPPCSGRRPEAANGGDRGERGGRTVARAPTRGGRYFIYRPPLEVVPAVGSETSGEIRLEEAELPRRMGFQAQ